MADSDPPESLITSEESVVLSLGGGGGSVVKVPRNSTAAYVSRIVNLFFLIPPLFHTNVYTGRPKLIACAKCFGFKRVSISS